MAFSTLKRIARLGLSPSALASHAFILRTLGLLPKPRTTPPSAIQSIFFSFPYHSVGDVILSLTLLERVHALWPEAAIDVAVGATTAPLLAALEFVRNVFTIPRPATRQPLLAAYAGLYAQTRVFHSQIASIPYDLAIAPRWDAADSFFSAHLAYLTGAPLRCGYAGDGDVSSPVGHLYTHTATGGAHEHESLRYTGLLARCGFESISALDPEIAHKPLRCLMDLAVSRLASGIAHAPPSPYLVLSPGATNPRRMWPTERYAEVARNLFEQHGLIPIIVGSPADQRLCENLRHAIGPQAISMAGKTDTLHLLDLIAAATLLLGNDSGPAHLAGALGVKTFVVSPFPLSSDLFHVNSPRRFHPVGPRVHVLQPHFPSPPCTPFCLQHYPHCILQISAQQVLAVIPNPHSGARHPSP